MPEGNDVIPKTEPELVIWFQNWIVKIPNYQVKYGFTLGQVTASQTACQAGIVSVQMTLQAKAYASDWVAFKNIELYGPVGGPTPTLPPDPSIPAFTIVTPGILDLLRGMIGQMKGHINWTLADGEDLDIIASGTGDPDPIKPTGTVLARPASEAEIRWLKGNFDGVMIEMRRGGAGFVRLSLDNRSPYIDTTPPLVAGQPEVREYRLWYVRGNDIVGEPSDIITVTTIP